LKRFNAHLESPPGECSFGQALKFGEFFENAKVGRLSEWCRLVNVRGEIIAPLDVAAEAALGSAELMFIG